MYIALCLAAIGNYLMLEKVLKEKEYLKEKNI